MDLDSPPTAEEASEAQENRIFKMLVGYTRQNAKVRSLSNDKLDHFPEGISGIILGHLGLKGEAVRMMKVSKDWNKWMKVYFQKNIRGMYFVNRDATLMKNIFSFLTFKERDKFEAVLQQVEESAPLTEGR